MINLAVISLKDIIKILKRIIIFFAIILLLSKICKSIKNEEYTKIEELKQIKLFDCSSIIDNTLLVSNLSSNEKVTNTSGIKKILVSELSLLYTEEELMEIENQEEVIEFEDISLNSEKEVQDETIEKVNIDNTEIEVTNVQEITDTDIPINLPTKIIDLNNKKDTYTDTYRSVKIKNESKYQLTEEILTPNYELQNKKDIIIYHTHTCESYTPTEKDNYVASGNFRTTDLNYSVAGVGKELEKYLINTFNIKHNTAYHDYPAYSGSYTRSLSTIKSMVTENYSRISYRFT